MKNYLDLKNNKNFESLIEPAKIIKNGGIVIFPTETVYGVGTNGFNEKSIKKLYEIKKRPLNKPISLLVNSIDMVEQIAKDITPIEYKLINKFFPGPLTIILKKKDTVSDILTAGLSTVGVRIPESDIALNLIKMSGVPIATSSANISGNPNETNISNIINDFQDDVDYFIDGGKVNLGLPSTIVQIVDGKVHILREGPISLEQINSAIQNYS